MSDVNIGLLVRDYVDHLVQKHSPDNTVQANRTDLSQFANFSRGLVREEVSEIDEQMISFYVEDISGKYANATVGRKLSSLKEFLRWAVENQVLDESPAENISAPPIAKTKNYDLLSHAELETLLGTAEGQAKRTGPDESFIRPRDWAVLELICSTGMKSSEVAKLQYSQLTKDMYEIKPRARSDIVLRLSRKATEALNSYSASKRARGSSVFTNERSSGSITRQWIYHLVKNAADAAELGRKVTPQDLRDTFAASYLQRERSISNFKEILGVSKSAAYCYAAALRASTNSG